MRKYMKHSIPLFRRVIYWVMTIQILMVAAHSIAQNDPPPTIYLFPGQGSDYRIFDSLQLPENWPVIHVSYHTPSKKESMETYALTIAQQIDSTQPFVLIGVSLGGMICSEIANKYSPLTTILISSAQSKRDLPLRYRFQHIVPLYKIFPARAIHWGAQTLQPIVEPDQRTNRACFEQMLAAKVDLYMKRTVGLIVNWNRISTNPHLHHIHGNADRTLPLRCLKEVDVVIENGSHLMTLTRGREISRIILEILKSEHLAD